MWVSLEQLYAMIIGACMGASVLGVFGIFIVYLFPAHRSPRILRKKKHLTLIEGGVPAYRKKR
jgi:hypothetical protein